MSLLEDSQPHQGVQIKRYQSLANKNVDKTPAFEAKKRTLQNSVLDYQKGKQGLTARTNYAYQNPQNNNRSNIIQSGKSIYIKQKEVSLPNKVKSKYDNAANIYADFIQKDGSNVRGQCVLQNTEKQTLRKLIAMSIKHHDPTLCVCAYCTCGRHLCKIHPYKPPGVKPYSTYKKDYNKKTPFDDVKFRPSTSYKDNGIGIDPLSTYTKDYPPKQTQLDPKYLPNDLLKTGGPFSGLTTYGTGFPGYKSPMTQLIKPIGGQVLHGFPFNGNTSYRKQYTPKNVNAMDAVKPNGNLKIGQPWIGSSTYRDNFIKPTNTYGNGWKSKISNIPDPKYANQFDTTYKNDYIPMQSTICPAIPELLSRSKFFSASKNKQMMNESRRAMSKIKGTS